MQDFEGNQVCKATDSEKSNKKKESQDETTEDKAIFSLKDEPEASCEENVEEEDQLEKSSRKVRREILMKMKKENKKVKKKGEKSGNVVVEEAKPSMELNVEENASKTNLEETEEVWEHDKQPPILAAVDVEYCPRCGLPYDFCEFGGQWESCKSYALQNFGKFYVKELYDKNESEKSKSEINLAHKIANLKIKNSKKNEMKKNEIVEIALVSRAKRKNVTVIKGLHSYNIKLDKAAKIFAKVFSCGASAIKDNSGLNEEIDVQGDVRDSICSVITSNFPQVPLDKIIFLN